MDFFKLANFHEKQLEAADAIRNADFTLYGGAAGGGKSYWIRWMAVNRLMTFFSRGLKNVRVGIFCESYTALDDRHLSKIPFEFPPWLGSFHQGKREFHLSPEYGSGVIAFRNLDDVSKYLSSEFADISVDELTMNRRETFDFLVTRMRWPGITDNKFISASNPGQIGHGWVKKLFIDKNFEDEPVQLASQRFKYVRALYTDNPHIDAVSYGKRLASMPEHLRRAYMEGDWDIFAGQFFTEFRRDLHVIEPWSDASTWAWFNALPTFCGLDWGYSDPSAVLWAKFWDNTWYIYRELYVAGLTFEELRDKITEIEEPAIIYADPSIWAKKDSPTSGAQKMAPLRLKPAMNDRVIGWTILKQALKAKRVKIFSTCVNLIRVTPNMVYNESANSKKEDMQTIGVEDHLPDAWRYLVASHQAIVQSKVALTYLPKTGKIQSNGGQKDLDSLFSKQKSTYLPKYHK